MKKKIYNRLFLRACAILFVSVIVYRIVLDYIYERILAEYYSYYGFTNRTSIGFIFISWCILIFFTTLLFGLYDNMKKVSSQVLFILFLISIVPFTTMIAYGVFYESFIISNTIYFSVLFGANYIFDKTKKRKIFLNVKFLDSYTGLRVICIAFILFVVFMSWRYTGFRLSLNIFKAIDWRYEAVSYDIPTIFRYIFSWTKCIISILMVYFIIKREYIWTVLCIIAQLLAFGINGMKFTLFIGVAVFVIAWLPKPNERIIGIMFSIAIMILSVLSVLEYIIFNTWYLASVFVMRILFIPNEINLWYYDFFTNNTPDYYRGSFLRNFGFQTPYIDLQHYITKLYYPTQNTDVVPGSNNGLLSDAITNMGMVGIIVLPILLIIILKLLDRTMYGLDIRIKISQSLSLSLLLISTFLFPLLLTDGLLFMFFVFAIMSRSELKHGFFEKHRVL